MPGRRYPPRGVAITDWRWLEPRPLASGADRADLDFIEERFKSAESSFSGFQDGSAEGRSEESVEANVKLAEMTSWGSMGCLEMRWANVSSPSALKVWASFNIQPGYRATLVTLQWSSTVAGVCWANTISRAKTADIFPSREKTEALGAGGSIVCKEESI